MENLSGGNSEGYRRQRGGSNETMLMVARGCQRCVQIWGVGSNMNMMLAGYGCNDTKIKEHGSIGRIMWSSGGPGPLPQFRSSM